MDTKATSAVKHSFGPRVDSALAIAGILPAYSANVTVTATAIAFSIAIALFLAGAAIGIAIGIAVGRAREGTELPSPPTDPIPDLAGTDTGPPPQVPEPNELDPRILSLLRDLPGMVIVTDAAGNVVLASDPAIKQRLVQLNRLSNDELSEAAGTCTAQQQSMLLEVTVVRPPLRRGRLDLLVRAIHLDGDYAVLLLEDLTEVTRLSAVRRDFIANISHELKTPVGAMSLLAEALVAASDDPAAVEHFASRLQSEASRLSRLINDVIELSRLQGEDPMSDPIAINVGALINEALESVASAAEVKGIHVIVSSSGRDLVAGSENQLLIALTNLLSNAIAYSEPDTNVAIAVRGTAAFVEIAVKDQGIGIPVEELDRIFERFYRIDEARSRATGGTGLGLAIVRNVCQNHGGSVSVWSVEGEGSTFTMKLPIPGQGLLADLDPRPKSHMSQDNSTPQIPTGVFTRPVDRLAAEATPANSQFDPQI